MMQRDVHLRPEDLLKSLQFEKEDFAEIGIISGQAQRAQRCLKFLNNPVKNFTFLGYTFWTGEYSARGRSTSGGKGKRITVGNGGFYAPDSAFITELLCTGGIKILIRLGSCGALREDIGIGDFIVATGVIRGDGVTRYYVDDNFFPYVDETLSDFLEESLREKGRTHRGKVWTTDALLRETKDIVNSYIEKGAIAVDMVSSPFVTIANLYKVRVACILAVSDNLITGQLGFTDLRFFTAEEKMMQASFEVVERIEDI